MSPRSTDPVGNPVGRLDSIVPLDNMLLLDTPHPKLLNSNINE
jgi:hypothetical protein